jgi:hypothetical protein
VNPFRPALVAVAALAAAVGLARAEPLPIGLVVSRSATAQGCPDGTELAALVEQVARRPHLAGGAGGAGIEAEIAFERTFDRLRATVRLGGAKTGERELTDTGPSCAPLAQAVAITLVLLADHGPEAAMPTASPAAEPVPQPSAWRAGRVSAAGGAGLGLVSTVAGTLAVGMSAERRSGWGLAGEVFLVTPRRTARAPGEVRVWELAAGAQLCRAAGDDRRTLFAVCAGGAAGYLAAQGFGYPTSRAAGFPWFAASARVALGGPIAVRLRWLAQAELLVPLRRQSFSIDGLGPAWESRPVGARLELGAEVSLW